MLCNPNSNSQKSLNFLVMGENVENLVLLPRKRKRKEVFPSKTEAKYEGCTKSFLTRNYTGVDRKVVSGLVSFSILSDLDTKF